MKCAVRARGPAGYRSSSVSPLPAEAPADACLAGGGEAGALLRSIDWSKNPLGPVRDWPATLRTTVGIMLSSSFAMRVLWGPDFILLHNDAYRPVLGATKYPGAMGSRCADSFAELWDVVGPMFRSVMAGETVALDDRILPLERFGYLEECFFTLSYSPLSDDRGGIGGVLGIVYETTQRVIAERRLHALRQLAAGVARAKTTAEVCTIAAETFAHAGADVPFALFYLHGSDETNARLVASTGLDAYPRARPAVVELAPTSHRETWPLPTGGDARMWRVTDLRARHGELHGGPYPEPITDAIVVPLRRPGAAAPYGFLVVGLSPRRAFDGEYEAFLELAAEHIGAAIANAVAIDYIDGERRRLRSFLLEAPAAIAVFRGPELVYDLVNDRFVTLLGRSAEELLGKPGSKAIPVLNVQPIWKILAEVYATGEPFRALEFASNLDRNRDGVIELAYFDWLGQVTRDAQGVIDGVLLFVVEVTEQVKGRRSSEASRKFIEGVVNQMPAGVVIAEAPSGRTVLANALAESLVGRFDIEVDSSRRFAPQTVFRPDGTSYPPSNYPIVRAIAGELVLDEEIIFVQPDGRRRILQVSASPVYDAERNLVAGVSTFVDITDRRRADEERKALLERAETARSVAESASRAKDDFVAIVSHELRNPLNAMLGWTRLLRTGSLSEERTARALETIERNATNQAQLIEDLLDVSRVVSGKLTLDVQTVTFASVIESALDSARPAIEAKGLRLSVVLDTEGVLSGDPGRLQQIVWNLLTNATKFTPRGGSIRVVLRRDESHLELSVSDSGQGIAASFLDHVFDRFKQADPSTTRQHGGLGLGLSIAKNLVEMHGGTIEAQSEGLGKGATFVVRVPIAAMRRSPVPQVPERKIELTAVIEAPPELVGLRVLVVDDEPDAREIVTAVLVQCGAIVTTAGSAADALDAVAHEPPDVLLSDIGMPDEDGYALIARIRAMPRARGGATPAACLTGYTTASDRRRALDAGFNMHLAKPIEPSELVAVVANLGRMAKALGDTR
jgi:signal transduction histidine kinase/ActR/RegA family two-component response regulator